LPLATRDIVAYRLLDKARNRFAFLQALLGRLAQFGIDE
jgi:hypothetical protein